MFKLLFSSKFPDGEEQIFALLNKRFSNEKILQSFFFHSFFQFNSVSSNLGILPNIELGGEITSQFQFSCNHSPCSHTKVVYHQRRHFRALHQLVSQKKLHLIIYSLLTIKIPFELFSAPKSYGLPTCNTFVVPL